MLSEHTISLFNKSVLFNTVSRSGHLILWDVLIIVYLGHKFFWILFWYNFAKHQGVKWHRRLEVQIGFLENNFKSIPVETLFPISVIFK